MHIASVWEPFHELAVEQFSVCFGAVEPFGSVGQFLPVVPGKYHESPNLIQIVSVDTHQAAIGN